MFGFLLASFFVVLFIFCGIQIYKDVKREKAEEYAAYPMSVTEVFSELIKHGYNVKPSKFRNYTVRRDDLEKLFKDLNSVKRKGASLKVQQDIINMFWCDNYGCGVSFYNQF